MAAGDISLTLMIGAQNLASGVISSVASSLGIVGLGIAGVAAVAGVAGIAAVKMAGSYQAATTQLVTGAGESARNLDMVRQGILNVSVATGTSTDALVKAMFLIESSGAHGASGLNLLKIAAQGAKVGNADLAQTADILTTTLHDFHMATSQAVPVMNFLISSVKNGKMTMDNLNQSLKNVLPVASALHVPLASVAGALDTMAMSGDKGAGAGTHLAMMFKMLANPAITASKEMVKMGIDSIKLAQTMQTSLPNALQMIQDAVSKHFVAGSVQYNRAIAAILGGSKSGIAGLEIMGGSFKDLVANTNAAAKSLRSGGSAVQGWAMVQGNLNTQIDMAKQAVGALFIQVGMKLLPAVTQLVSHITPAISAFTQWAFSGHAVSDVMTIFAVVMQRVHSFIAPAIPLFQAIWRTIQDIGGGLRETFLPVWKQLVTTFQSSLLPSLKQLWEALTPLMPVLKDLGVIVGATLVVAIGLLIGIVGGLISAFAGLLQGLIIVIGGVVQLFTGLVQFFSGVVMFIYDLFTGNFSKLGSDLGRIWSGIVNMGTGFGNILKGLFVEVFAAIGGFVVGFVSTIIGFFKHLFDMLVGHSIIPNMINSIVSWFASLPGKALGAVGALAGRLASFFGGLASQALQWGANILSNLASGIIGAIGSTIGNAMSAVGGFIHDHLPASPAKRGPLRDLALQGSLIPAQIAQGMLRGIPQMQLAMNALVKPIAATGNMAYGGGVSAGNSFALGGHTIVVKVEPVAAAIVLDGKKVGTNTMKHAARELRIQGNVKLA
jgi:TP901 family phage tail tape measure protein